MKRFLSSALAAALLVTPALAGSDLSETQPDAGAPSDAVSEATQPTTNEVENTEMGSEAGSPASLAGDSGNTEADTNVTVGGDTEADSGAGRTVSQ